MQFITIQNEVYSQLGLDSSDSANQTLVKRWINLAQQDVASRANWKWLYSREAIATVPDETGGTVSVNSGGTTVTGVGTDFTDPTDVGRFIQFAGSEDWYRISAIASTTSLTIANAYVGTSNLSGATYVMRKWFYSLSSSAERLLGFSNFNSGWRLVQIDYRTFDILRPNPDSTGSPGSFIAYGYDSSGNIQFTIYPFPDDARLLEARILKRLSDLSADADLSAIPARDHQVLIFGGIAYGYMHARKPDLAGVWNGKFESKIEDMLRVNRTSEDNFRVMESIDRSGSMGLVRFPEDYPEARRLFG